MEINNINRSRVISTTDLTKVSDTLDMLDVAPADHNHTWTSEQRAAFDEASRILRGTQ